MNSSYRLWDLFVTKLYLNLRSEVSRTYLGYLWWLLEPTLYVAVLYLVFGVLLERGMPDFVVFLVCGSIPFLWFSKTVSNATASILGGIGIISQVRVPKMFFPLMVVAQDTIKQLLVFVLLFAFLFWYGIDTWWNWYLLVPVILVQWLFIFTCAIVVAGITPFVPDLKFVIPTAMLMMMMCSGVFYSYESVVDADYQSLFLTNPMANLINSYRLVLLEGTDPDWQGLANIALVSCFVSAFVAWIYQRMDDAFTRLAMQ